MTTAHHPCRTRRTRRDRDRGFTLVEILIAIVLVGILSAVVVIGVSSLTKKGNSSACTASLDASKTAAIAYFTTTGTFPTTFDQMLSATPAVLTLPSDVTHSATTVTGANAGWTLTLTPGATGVAPSFACS